MVTVNSILEWVSELQKKYAEKKEYLVALDSAIGDADHGVNMDRGFTAVLSELQNTHPDSIGSALKIIAMVLIKTVGGASGPLYGTFFLKASMEAGTKKELTVEELYTIFSAGVEGVKSRGKASVGDKTMIDAWVPALEAMKSRLNGTGDLKESLKAAAEGAEQGMLSTKELLAKKGRASYLGERSVGHQDPGATSTFYMLEAAAKTLSWRDGTRDKPSP